MTKKYFWLKLKDDFFEDKRIKKMRRIAGGDTYTVIYLKMQLLSLQKEGILEFEGIEETFVQELALEIDEDEQNVEFTVMYLTKVGLLEEVDTDKYMMLETVKSIGYESESAERVRKHREKKKLKEKIALQCNESNVTSVTCNTEIEKEIEKEKKKESLKDMVDSKESTERSNVDIQFEEWWNAYNKKTNKKASFTKFKNVLKKHDFELLMKNTLIYASKFTTDNKYQKNPDTFLNNYEPEDIIFQQPNNSYNNYNTSQQQPATNLQTVNVDDLFRDC